MAILSELICRCKTIPIKIPVLCCCFWENDMPILIHMEIQGTQDSKTLLEKEEKNWKGTHTLQFQNLLLNYHNQDVMVLA